MTTTWPPLSDEDRNHGFVVLKLLSEWPSWVKRRTETITFLGDSAVQRKVAVDFRMREDLFRQPFVRWGERGMHYVPLAFMEKQPLMAFDLRDETGAAVPLLTRHKNAAMGAAALSALARSIVAQRLREAAREGARGARGFKEVKPTNIRLPEELERDFLSLTTLKFHDRTARRPDARGVFRSFTTLSRDLGEVPSPEHWAWRRVRPSVPGRGNAPEAYTVDDAPAAWRALMVQDDVFYRLAYGLARTFLLFVPIAHEPGNRRIIKYAYAEPIREPILEAWHQTKSSDLFKRRFGRLREIEDGLEGLPVGGDPFEEWSPVGEGAPRETIPVRTKVLRAVTWRAKSIKFNTPAVGWGGSYHLEVVAPEGTQLRRASLESLGPHETQAHQRALRGARNLDRAHLYLGEVMLDRAGQAEIALKPRSSTIVRTAAVTALLITGALLLTFLHLDAIRHDSGTLEIAGALLLIVPGLLAVYTARGGEHPMTTSMLYGLRLLTASSGVWAVAGVGLLLAGPADDARLFMWLFVLLLSLLTTIVLAVGWRLAARGRPMEQIITERVGGP